MQNSNESSLNGNKSIGGIFEPIQRFFKTTAAGGVVLMLVTAVALIWANLHHWGHYYHELWETHLAFSLGSFEIDMSLHHWINDALMGIFFFVVGLEIKREMLAGELASVKKASLPIIAAIGGMLVPAGIYLFLNDNPDAARGWGVPMATDIAFSLGVLSLLGKRVPLALKVFLVAFAIVDDLGAVLVIALFYTDDLAVNFLIIAGLIYLILILLNRFDFRGMWLYGVLGIFMWYLFLNAGVHPTLAFVLLAFVIPASRKAKIRSFKNSMDKNLEEFIDNSKIEHDLTLNHEQMVAADNMSYQINRVQSPLQKFEHRLSGFVTFFVMPIFALANAGVAISGGEGGGLAFQSILILISLLFGKLIGVTFFSWIGVKLNLCELPTNTKWINVVGLALLGGMGFTMSLFVANLAFDNAILLDQTKIGILLGSFIAGVAGYFTLKLTLSPAKSNKN